MATNTNNDAPFGRHYVNDPIIIKAFGANKTGETLKARRSLVAKIKTSAVSESAVKDSKNWGLSARIVKQGVLGKPAQLKIKSMTTVTP